MPREYTDEFLEEPTEDELIHDPELYIIELAKQLEEGFHNGYFDGWSAEQAKDLVEALHGIGWETVPIEQVHSVCSKAFYEVNIQKDGKRMNVVATNFMGAYVQCNITAF